MKNPNGSIYDAAELIQGSDMDQSAIAGSFHQILNAIGEDADMLPFLGRVHVAYMPHGRIIGLSKIPRIVDMFARRLQVLERMTRQIEEFITELPNPHGVAVVVEACIFVQ